MTIQDFNMDSFTFSQFTGLVSSDKGKSYISMSVHAGLLPSPSFSTHVIALIFSTFSGSGEIQPFCHKLNASFIEKAVIAASCMEPKIFILFNNQTL